jgi:SAM-dependent methyltransferase
VNEWDPATYGDRWAGIYDEWYADLGDIDAVVTTVSEMAAGRPVLELGIGTGRLALPLAARGVDVTGVDASAAMVARLREKPGGPAIPVVIGDMADVPVEGRFGVVFVAFNTFFNLTSQDEQIRCLTNVAAHLDEGGVFVVEGFVPDTGTSTGAVEVRSITADEVVLFAFRHDPFDQVIDAQTIVLSNDGIRLFPLKARYAPPSELDLMARLAGLRLRDRWGGWNRCPFAASSGVHVSVYQT